MDSLTIKVTYNNDTRKITSTSEELFGAIAARFGLDSADLVVLQFDNHVVDLDQIISLAVANPGKAVKLALITPHEDESTDEEEPTNETGELAEIEPKVAKAEAKAAKQAAKAEAKAAKQAAKAAKQAISDSSEEEPTHKTNELEGDMEPKLIKQAAKAAKQAAKAEAKAAKAEAKAAKQAAKAAKQAISDSSEEEPTHETNELDSPDEEGDMDPKILKEQVQAAKQAAKVARAEAKAASSAAKAEAKAAAKAEKAAAKAEMAAKKAAARAAKQAAKAEAKAAKQAAKKEAEPKENPNKIVAGKLVNWGCGQAVTGEIIILPCGRVCFHVESHPGNLRVNNNHKLQKQGGCGPWAQFHATPHDSKPGVFQLMSHAHSECFLGTNTAEAQDSALQFAAGVELAVVGNEDESTWWSFYPAGSVEMLELEPPAPLPTPEEVYNQLRDMVTQLSCNTGLPIQMSEAPEDERALAEMLNKLHDFLPHGVKRIAMKKLGLRQFDIAEPEPEPEVNQEWDLLLDDLKDMGFDCDASNREAVQASGGDLKKAIKVLVQAGRQ